MLVEVISFTPLWLLSEETLKAVGPCYLVPGEVKAPTQGNGKNMLWTQLVNLTQLTGCISKLTGCISKLTGCISKLFGCISKLTGCISQFSEHQ